MRTSRQILLIREHEQQALLHFSVTQYPVQLLLRLIYSFTILAVHDENKALRACVVVPPQRPNFVLASDVPDIELHVLICYSFHIETDYSRASDLARDKERGGNDDLLGWW